MADVVDEFGNPIQVTDDRGNPVQLTDEHGNPMHLTGVAFHEGAGAGVVAVETKVEAKVGGAPEEVYSGEEQHVGGMEGPEGEGKRVGGMEGPEGEGKREEKLERSSSSSSSEDDGQGGRRKKKGIKEKIKEKLHVGTHKDKEEHAPYPTPVTSETRPGEHNGQQEHEKKSMMEKIKEKLPGHH